MKARDPALTSVIVISVLLCSSLLIGLCQGSPRKRTPLKALDVQTVKKTLVSYAYFEKDAIQRLNFAFFLLKGVGVSHDGFKTNRRNADFHIVVTGNVCTPCATIRPHVIRLRSVVENVDAWSGGDLTVLRRKENVGMDIAAHNVSLDWTLQQRRMHMYEYFIFLNSSVRGPFFPSYMPRAWQWTQAFTQGLTKVTKIVGSSLVCLPPQDPGGYGPKIESWAFAVDAVAVKLLIKKGIFYNRECKVCHGEKGIVVMGEYGMSKALLDAGYNLKTLMSRYSTDTDWRDKKNWNCNDNVHPSRHGTYDGVSMHPFETLFVKSSWFVGEPHLSRYTKWYISQEDGGHGTQGAFNEDMYYYAMCLEGRYPANLQNLFKPKNLTCTGS